MAVPRSCRDTWADSPSIKDMSCLRVEWQRLTVLEKAAWWSGPARLLSTVQFDAHHGKVTRIMIVAPCATAKVYTTMSEPATRSLSSTGEPTSC